MRDAPWETTRQTGTASREQSKRPPAGDARAHPAAIPMTPRPARSDRPPQRRQPRQLPPRQHGGALPALPSQSPGPAPPLRTRGRTTAPPLVTILATRSAPGVTTLQNCHRLKMLSPTVWRQKTPALTPSGNAGVTKPRPADNVTVPHLRPPLPFSGVAVDE
jgi:hypothetical protein